jgi:hypothetical protein
VADEVITAEEVAEIALGAKTFTSDGQTAETHKLSDILDARDRLNQNTAASNKARGLRFTKLSPPGPA